MGHFHKLILGEVLCIFGSKDYFKTGIFEGCMHALNYVFH